MFSPALIGFLFGIGVATWVYNRFYSSTGGNSRTALILAAMAGVGSFVVILIAYAMLF